MSANPLDSFGASDSGILHGLEGMLSKAARLDRGHGAANNSSLSRQELPTARTPMVHAELEQELLDVPLPEGFLRRMRDAIDQR